MSYNIGQLNSNQIDSYGTSSLEKTTPYTLENLIKKDDINSIAFYDRYLSLNSAVVSTYSYYLKFEVTQRKDSAQEFSIKLQSVNGKKISNIQNIRNFIVPMDSKENKITFELIFTPNSTYNQMIFELERTNLDFTINNTDGKSGRIMEITILQFDKITNIISDYLVHNYEGMTSLKQIGIQGPPGLLFCIDGEEIRVGRSGIYELYNEDIKISYIGFIIKEKDFFIMDFKY